MKTKEEPARKSQEEMVALVDTIAEYGHNHHRGFLAVAEVLYAMLGHTPAVPDDESTTPAESAESAPSKA